MIDTENNVRKVVIIYLFVKALLIGATLDTYPPPMNTATFCFENDFKLKGGRLYGIFAT